MVCQLHTDIIPRQLSLKFIFSSIRTVHQISLNVLGCRTFLTILTKPPVHVETRAVNKYCSYDLQHNCQNLPSFISDVYLLRLSFLAPQIISALASSTNTGFTGVCCRQYSTQTMKHLCSFSSILSQEFYYLGHYLWLPAILC